MRTASNLRWRPIFSPVPGTGIEPVLPQWKLDFTYHLRLSPPPMLLGVCGLDFIFTIATSSRRCSPSSLYTFLIPLMRLSSVSAPTSPLKRSPNLTSSTPEISLRATLCSYLYSCICSVLQTSAILYEARTAACSSSLVYL